MVDKIAPITPIILAGGFGTRVQNHLDRPKQFAVHAYTSLYQDTLDRVSFLNAPLVISNISHKAYIESQSPHDTQVIYESVSRNTGAAVIIGALTLQSMGHKNAIILPSDHVIRDTIAFQNDVLKAKKHLAKHHHGILFGIEPNHPSSQFGYIQTDNFGNVTSFCEKPDTMRASELLAATRNTYWNSGIFMFEIDTVLSHLQQTCPDFIRQCQTAIDTPTIETFNAISALPFDALYLEQAHNLFCIEASFDWLDIGTPDALSQLKTMSQ